MNTLKTKLILLCLLTVMGCSDETPTKIIEVEKVHSWTLHPSFKDKAKIVTNSRATNDLLFFYGPLAYSTITKTNTITHYLSSYSTESFIKMPIGPNFFVEAFDGFLNIDDLNSLTSNSVSYHTIMKEYDTNFVSYNIINDYTRESSAINDSNQWLFSFKSKNEPIKPNLCLLTIDTKYTNDFDQIKISNKKVIIISDPQDLSGRKPILIVPYKNCFFVTYDFGTFKIYSNGTYKKVLDDSPSYTRRIFSHNGVLYLTLPQIIFISTDNGETWTKSFNISETITSNAGFHTIRDSLVEFHTDKLYTVSINLSGYSLRELDNDGLEGNQITSVSEFMDSIYVSTTTGVFIRPKSSFFNPKKVE
ncbi:MAG: hypothetical protein HYZ42_08345 [Bacteroidetes bacterium]|nr:hypothetical protein [Bacteroidota bacterium]